MGKLNVDGTEIQVLQIEEICLSNMENINAVLIEDGLSKKDRLIKLNKIAIHQMSILETQTITLLK